MGFYNNSNHVGNVLAPARNINQPPGSTFFKMEPGLKLHNIKDARVVEDVQIYQDVYGEMPDEQYIKEKTDEYDIMDRLEKAMRGLPY